MSAPATTALHPTRTDAARTDAVRTEPARTEQTAGDSAAMHSVERLLRSGQHFLLTSHARPDGDAVGSILAFGGILDQLGKTYDLVLADPVPQVYLTLPGVARIRHTRTVEGTLYDAAIILECDSIARTGLSGFGDLPLLNIDHHITGSDFASINWIDWDTCAVAVMVYRLALALEVEVTPAMATCLYTAVFTDTGAFTYPGTAGSTFPLAQELIALGANADTIARDVLYSVSAAHIRLLGVALSRLQIRGVSAWSYITQQDISSVQASDEDSEGTVNYLISIAGVEAALFLRELPAEGDAPPRFRASLRSKSSLDVSAVAAICGGGGHRNAAGCVLDGPLDAAVARVLAEVDAELKQLAANA